MTDDPRKIVIALAGRMQSGKSTAACFLRDFIKQEAKPSTVEIMSFALPIKRICHDYLGYNLDHLTGSYEAKSMPGPWDWSELAQPLREKYPERQGPVSAREMMQVLGSEVFRQNFAPDVWVKIAALAVRRSTANVIIFDDARLPNELRIGQMCKLPSLQFLIQRPGLPKSAHPSETALDNVHKSSYNCLIMNNGTLEQYREQILSVGRTLVLDVLLGR